MIKLSLLNSFQLFQQKLRKLPDAMAITQGDEFAWNGMSHTKMYSEYC